MGIKEFIIPVSNKKDYEKIEDDKMKDDIKVHYVKHIDEVFGIIFKV